MPTAFGQDTIATDVAALKTYYAKDQVLNSTILRINQFMGLVPKMSDFSGTVMPIPIQSSGSPGISVDFNAAYTNQQAGVYEAFKVPTVPIYNLATVANQAIQASRNETGGFKSLMKAQTDASMRQCSNYIANYMFRDGSGSLASIQLGSTISGGILTLTNQTDAQFFFKGLVLTASATSSATPRAATGVVIAVNVPAGQIAVSTVAGGPATQPSDWQAGDFVQIQGTFNKVPFGLQSWLPISSATYPGSNQSTAVNTLYGVDRSVDSASYAGTFFDGSAMNIKDALISGVSQIINNGGSPTILIMSPNSLAALDKELQSQYAYSKVSGPSGVSFDAVTLNTPFGPLPVLSDRNCPPKSCWALDMEQLELFSMGQCPGIMPAATNDDMFHYQDRDSVQVRVGTYWGMAVKNPRSCGSIALRQ